MRIPLYHFMYDSKNSTDENKIKKHCNTSLVRKYKMLQNYYT